MPKPIKWRDDDLRRADETLIHKLKSKTLTEEAKMELVPVALARILQILASHEEYRW